MNNLRLSLAALFLLFTVTPASAIVLRGVVSEVRDGETLIIITTNKQKVTVILKGVDAPELKQEFGDLAQQHLAALVLNRMVEVDFTEMRGESLIGKVICNNADIGLQVIRDGAAWYAAKSDHNLSEAEHRVYLEAEQVARTERRGLWQDGTPMPPWEWRRAEATKNTRTTYKTNRTMSSLSREDVLPGKRSPAVNRSVETKQKTSLPKPTGRPLNTPGLDYDFRAYLNQDRVSIVYFYADWCPSCRQTNPLMDEINKQIPDMQVLFMNIGEWNTPVAQQYGVSYVPYLMIYDKSGNLVASGKGARAWLAEALRQR